MRCHGLVGPRKHGLCSHRHAVPRRYKRPFLEAGQSRLPTLVWPRQIPIQGEGPQDVVDAVSLYSAWAATSLVPKLYVESGEES